jgi:hypothetical protein
MTPPTPAEVRTISLSAAFAGVPDGTIAEATVEVVLLYGALEGLDVWPRIVALHVCHLLVLGGLVPGEGVGGPVTSASAGAVSASYGVGSIEPGAGVDERTSYGARCLRLLRALGPALQAGAPIGWV